MAESEKARSGCRKHGRQDCEDCYIEALNPPSQHELIKAARAVLDNPSFRDEFPHAAEQLRAALPDPVPPADRCPTCGGTDYCEYRGHSHPWGIATPFSQSGNYCCPDPFHGTEASEGDERCACWRYGKDRVRHHDPDCPTHGAESVPATPEQEVRARRAQPHTSHCCPIHGCKYGDAECPVVDGNVLPEYPKNNGCERCEYESRGEPAEVRGERVTLWRIMASWEPMHRSYQAAKDHPAYEVATFERIPEEEADRD